MALSDLSTCLRTCTFSSELNWMSLAGGLVITILLGIAIVFMISRALNRRDWEAMARLELYHLSIAVIWIAIIAVVANTTCSLSCSITGEESPFTSAINYAASTSQKLQSLSVNLFEKAKNIRIESAVAFYSYNTHILPFSGCESIANTYENFAAILAPFIASMMVQQYALILINQIAFQFLLPIGIVLRLIPGLKDASSYIIGIAFALYIILPLTYVLADKATQGITVSSISTEGDSSCASEGEIKAIMQSIGSLLPATVFFPALSSIITIGAARAFSEIFKYDFAELRGE